MRRPISATPTRSTTSRGSISRAPGWRRSHPPAQALLGHLLVTGQGGIPRQKALGLMWLTLARQAAASASDQWISDLYEKSAEGASESERQRALSYVEQYQKRKR